MKLKLQPPLIPLKGVNQFFGQNFNNFYKEMGMLGHNGLDFFALDSTEVYATHDGRVTFTGYDGSGGLGVVIRTEEKFDYFNPETGQPEPSYFKTIYWHLKKDTIKVTGGQTVKTGDLIALADNTGRSTGAHLHFGLKPIYKGEAGWDWGNVSQKNGYMGAVDPMPYFDVPEPVDVPIPVKIYPVIRKGSRGAFVKELQTKLNTLLVIDGIFGKNTDKAVRDFQQKNGLVVDGIVGKNTWAKLNK